MADSSTNQNPENIQLGDIVYLKPGNGPAMVVDQLSETHAKCVWQLNGRHCEQEYSIASLTKTNPYDDIPLVIYS